MTYNILDIKDVSPSDFDYYFCDANVWIAVLKFLGGKNDKSYEEQYADFVNEIIITNNDTATKSKPKIILTNIVLSETLNVYLRDIAMKTYFKNKGQQFPGNFKDNYRDNTNSDYQKQLKTFVSDFSAFEDYIEPINDNFDIHNPFYLLKEMPLNTDFNDFYYYNLIKGKNIPIITHDKDFLLEDIPIITSNTKLLKFANRR